MSFPPYSQHLTFFQLWMGELMSVFEADSHSHNFLSSGDILICGVEQKLDLANFGQLLIVLVDDRRLLIIEAWIGRSELWPSELRSRREVPFNKNCWIYPLIKIGHLTIRSCSSNQSWTNLWIILTETITLLTFSLLDAMEIPCRRIVSSLPRSDFKDTESNLFCQ
jgi:hypothetical protein